MNETASQSAQRPLESGRSAEILESISDAFYAVDRNWCLTYVNRHAERWWGQSREALLGRCYWDVFPQAVGTEIHAAHLRVMAERRPIQIETISPLIHRWIAADIHPTANGGVSVYFRDISNRRKRDAELRRSGARLRLAVDAARMAIWEYDVAAERIEPTPELAAFLGVTEAQLGGEGALADLYFPGDRARIRAEGETALARGDSHFEVEFRFRRFQRESYTWLLLRAEILFDASGSPMRVIGAILDISRRKAAEEALRQLTDTLEEQVAERSRELLQAEEALRQSQKMEAIGQLTGGVAHDFNNLLTIIRSSVDLLRLGKLSEEKRARYLEAISDTVDRAAKLTSQLLAFARRQALAPEIFDAGERTRRIAEIVRTIAEARIRLDLDADCESCFIKADAAQFETALVNLAVNARDAMDGEGVLGIRLSPSAPLPRIRGQAPAPGEFVAISVCDTGSGIDPDTLPHIFEPFFTTKEVGKGTGLGLSQVYGFAKQSGGDVAVETERGKGTTFTLYLPRARPAEAVGTREQREGATVQGSCRILLVEDNPQVGEFATQLFEELGHRPTLAGNGAEALKRLQQGPDAFDLVFTDVVMPGMSGIELAHTIRRLYPGLRVVLTSGYSQALAAQGSHGFQLLRKPYSVDSINRALAGR